MSGPSPAEVVGAMLGEVDSPMVVVTAAAGDERSGCLVGFWTQCSIDPVRALVFLSDKNHTFGVAGRADHLAVHLLDVEQRSLAELFGAETGDEVDKFDSCRWSTGPAGLPVLDDVPAWFAGRILARHVAGDHVGFLLEPVAGDHRRAVRPLGLQSARHIDAGHEP